MIENIEKILKYLPGFSLFLKSDFWKLFKHNLILKFGDRQNSTFTGFLRLPSQYEALSGPVLDFLLADDPKKSLKIIVLGCSNGSEPYTIASVLKNRRPGLDFTIHAYDLYREIIYKAKSGTYDHKEIYCNPKMTPDFVQSTFDIENNGYKIKKEIADHIVFDVADALDHNLKNQVGTADIVFAQNFIVHLKPKLARLALQNIALLLNPNAVLFADGIDLGIRQKLTRTLNLVPLDYKIAEIHNEAQKERSYVWPASYWALEPFSGSKRDWRQRYSTIFLKK